MNWERAAPLLTLLLTVVCVWMVSDMRDDLKQDGPRLYGQSLTGDGVTTERWIMPDGKPEAREDFILRHQATVRALQDGGE